MYAYSNKINEMQLIYSSPVWIPLSLAIVFVFFRKCVRPRFSVRVSCWFCGETTIVPYGNKNCWDCPSCDQYNGFDKEGGYNKPIPSQYDDGLNHPISCEKAEFNSGSEQLCITCSQNQLLKVKQLANFVPYNEMNYNAEVEAYERYLEKVNKLCPRCQTRVEQELQVQDEIISKHMHNLSTSSQSFSARPDDFHVAEEPVVCPWNIIISKGLHGVSLLCAALLAVSKLHLDSEYSMVHSLIYLHPLLVWLDRYVVALSTVGLLAGLFAKLVLGKYRLHIIDVFSCPVWLLVLLLQTGTLPFQHSWYDGGCSVANTLICTICLGLHRRRRNKPNIKITRVSLDSSDSRLGTDISQFSSVSQPSKYNSKDLSTNQEPINKSHDHRLDELDDALTELDNISLGSPPTIRRTDSGIFTAFSEHSTPSNLHKQSISESLRRRRPLISPASFVPELGAPFKSSEKKFGLFSTPQHREQTSFTDQTPNSDTFGFRQFSAPRTTPLSGSPYTANLHRTKTSSRLLFSNKTATHPLSDSFGRPTSSERSFSLYRDRKCLGEKSVRKDLFARHDQEDDKISSYSVSTQCPVSSTTTSHTPQREAFWKHPGFIGFVLGGSLVANVLLFLNFIWKSGTP